MVERRGDRGTRDLGVGPRVGGVRNVSDGTGDLVEGFRTGR